MPFPAGAAWVAADGRRRASAVAGSARRDTLWDLASLTKPLLVGTLLMRAVASGAASLSDTVPLPDGRAVHLTDLLAHRAGLRAWSDLPAAVDAALGHARAGRWSPTDADARGALDAALARECAEADLARGTLYSDFGFILLGRELERRFGAPLAALVERAGLRGVRLGGLAPPPDARRFAPTELCPRRGRLLRGEVHDANAWALGGAAGHAGAFATAATVGRWALDLADAARGRPASLDGGVVRAFWDPTWRAPGGTWVLGWDTPSASGSTAGARVSASAVGHLGFTGTSVWIDREADLVTVLLTHRVAGGPGALAALRAFRPWFHDAVRELL